MFAFHLLAMICWRLSGTRKLSFRTSFEYMQWIAMDCYGIYISHAFHIFIHYIVRYLHVRMNNYYNILYIIYIFIYVLNI